MPDEAPKDGPGDTPKHDELIALTAEVIASYVSKNSVAPADLPELIGTVYGKLSALGAAPTESEVKQKPAVPIKRSVTNQAILCLECGKAQKILKRHLATAHDTTPEEYRAKWQLRSDYPLVAPDYAEKRRELAREIGLGRKPTKSSPKRKASRKKAG